MDFPQSRFLVRKNLQTHLTSAHLRKNILVAFRIFEFSHSQDQTGKARIEQNSSAAPKT
jgi:hypothetical protein